MKIKILALFVALSTVLSAHSVYHAVIQKGVSVKVFFDADDPASFAQYEITEPDKKTLFAKGRTDRNGVVSFLPDKPGEWKIKVIGESDHGYHGKEVTVSVDSNNTAENITKAPIEKYQKLIVGLSLVFGAFGVASAYNCKKKRKSDNG